MIDAFGTWIGTTVSRLRGWWLRRRDHRLPTRFFGEETQ